MSNQPNNAIAVIFPILAKHVSRLFSPPRCDVFVKFTKIASLKNGIKIIFYVSGKGILIGEGNVRTVEKLDPQVAWSRYKGRIFLDKSEFNSYSKISPISRQPRKMKQITVLVIKNVRKYKIPQKPRKPMIPSGRVLYEGMKW